MVYNIYTNTNIYNIYLQIIVVLWYMFQIYIAMMPIGCGFKVFKCFIKWFILCYRFEHWNLLNFNQLYYKLFYLSAFNREVIEGKISVECQQYENVLTTSFHCTAPCGAFSTQYACMCDYHTLPYREEVAWVIYLSILLEYFIRFLEWPHNTSESISVILYYLLWFL